jgi:predicted dehydrogenase
MNSPQNPHQPSPTSQTRRSFLKAVAGTAATFSLPARVYAAAKGANEAVRIGGIGFNGRGMGDLSGLLAAPNVRVTALCDVDTAVLDKGKAAMENAGQTVEVFSDLRKLIESKDVDAVMIATPNHWHTLAAIWAMQAGKDVYLEKPVSHTLWEGKQLEAAVKKHGAILQSGTQSRSSLALQEAQAWAKAGNLGRLLRVHGTCYKRRPSIGKVSGAQPIPATVDYDLWCGPSPKTELLRSKLHYDWHWVWDTGNGDLGNQGVHQVDIARWFMGEKGLPPTALSFGGRFGYVDDATTPNTQLIVLPYEKAPMYFEVRGLPDGKGSKSMDSYRGSSIGVVLQYEKGHLLIPSYSAVIAFDEKGEVIKRWGKYALPGEVPVVEEKADPAAPKPLTHHSNFISAVRSRDAASLSCNVREGVVSSALCHLAGISHRLGTPMSVAAATDRIKTDPYAAETLGRMFEHLKLNDALPENITLGALLKVDTVKETIVGNPAARALEHRKERAPYKVPVLA